MEKRSCIDSQKFANDFANSIMTGTNFNKKTISEDAKKYLICYLTALYLAQDFNVIENENFTASTIGKEKRFKDLSFDELMLRVKKLNKY